MGTSTTALWPRCNSQPLESYDFCKIAANVTIFAFLAIASPKANWTYAGMLLVFGLYAVSRRKTLATLPKITAAQEPA
jgi:hypothetical protein